MRVPEDISVVGDDDIKIARRNNPLLTTILSDMTMAGRLVAPWLPNSAGLLNAPSERRLTEKNRRAAQRQSATRPRSRANKQREGADWHPGGVPDENARKLGFPPSFFDEGVAYGNNPDSLRFARSLS